MDWKQEAIDKLRNYEARRADMEVILRDLERLEAAYTGIRAARLDGMPRSGSSASNREEDMVGSITRRDDLRRKLTEARLWVEIVEGGLSILDDEDRLTLHYCYIHKVKGAINELCERLNVEQATVYRKRDIALRRFTIALYGPLEGL